MALVPASLLPFKKEWQAVANGLPTGDVLVVLPPSLSWPRRVLERVAAQLRGKGRGVTTLPAARFG
jgi:hypothetical protein